MAHGEIFLIDDNPDILTLLARILREAGYRVRMATNGPRGIETVRAFPPELILLDITMPDMDGYETCEALKALPETRAIPVIFISALDDALDKVRAFDCGGVDYVTKPFNAAEVLARVGSQLKISRLQRESEARRREVEAAYETVRRSEEALKAANGQIARLMAASTEILGDTAAWAERMAREIQKTIGASDLGIWSLHEGRPQALFETTMPEPARELIRVFERGQGASESGPLVSVAIRGDLGSLAGVLGLSRRTAGWRPGEENVVTAFAHHLGTALELRSLRDQLSLSEARTAATRRELSLRGVELADICPACGRCAGRPPGEEAAGVCPADGTPLDSGHVLPLRLAGRYRLDRFIGEGGMGSVFSATDERLARAVAVKIIKHEHLNDSAMRFRLQREAQVLAAVQHPGVVSVFDSGELEDGSAFLVMELLCGFDLAQVLASEGRGSPAEVASLLRQAGAALASAHAAGVVHRDIKPANLFLVPSAAGGLEVKVVDFGLAQSRRLESRITQAGHVLGTPSYMSPEQVRGQDVDVRTDVYSLAAVGYEALCGERPVPPGQDAAESMLNVLLMSPRPVSSLLGGAPETLDRAFARALAKDRDNRPSSMEEWLNVVLPCLTLIGDEAERYWRTPATGRPEEDLRQPDTVRLQP